MSWTSWGATVHRIGRIVLWLCMVNAVCVACCMYTSVQSGFFMLPGWFALLSCLCRIASTWHDEGTAGRKACPWIIVTIVS